MPIGLPLLASLIAAGAGAAGTGLAIDQAVTAPGAPSTPTAAQPLTGPQQQQVKGAISSQLPDLQAQLGGSVAPDYYTQLAQVLSGTGGTPGTSGIAQQAVNSFTGNNSAGNNFNPAGLNPQNNIVGDQLASLTQNSFLG